MKANHCLTEVVFSGELVDIICWVRAHGQETDHRYSYVRLLPHLFNVQDHSFSILHSHRLRDILQCLRQNSIRTPRPEIRETM